MSQPANLRRKKDIPNRFDLGGCHDAQKPAEQGTLSELMEELNREPARFGLKPTVTLSRLQPALDFLETIGVSQIKSNELVPVTTLKTIKLLYLTNEKGRPDSSLERNVEPSKLHLFEMLASPHQSKSSTEFGFKGILAKDADRVEIIKVLTTSIAQDIDPERRRKIERVVPDIHNFLHSLALENKELLQPLRSFSRFPLNGLWTKVAAQLADGIDRFRPALNPSIRTVDETLYVYLRTLPFAHHVYSVEAAAVRWMVQHPITRIDSEIGTFCDTVAQSANDPFRSDPQHAFLSIDDVPDFIDKYGTELAALARAAVDPAFATVLAVEPKAFSNKQVRAKKKVIQQILFFHRARIIFHERRDDYAEFDAHIISTLDVIAGVCAIRYQNLTETKIDVYWHGQQKQGTDPTRWFSRVRDIHLLAREDCVPHAAAQFWADRCNEFLQAFRYQQEWLRVDLAFQRARLIKYAECLRSYNVDDIDQITTAFFHYSELLVMACAQPIAEGINIYESLYGEGQHI